MSSKFLLLLLCVIGTLVAKDINSAYINITSNVKDTIIYINDIRAGTVPINLYKVTPNKPLKIKAITNKDYYKNDIIKYVNVLHNTIPTYHIEFEKAKAKLFFVGVDADLYINDKFITALENDNRVHEVDANDNLKIQLLKEYKKTTIYKNVEANKNYEVEYELIEIPKDIRLKTSMINELMWEDTPHAANTQVSWEKAKEYCESLRIGEFKDWKLPTIEQLNDLHEKYKDEIYHGYGNSFYWSQSTSTSESKIWDYSFTKDFSTGKNRKPVKEFDNGLVRCVREIIIDENNQLLEDTTVNEVKKRDENLTENLERFLLK